MHKALIYFLHSHKLLENNYAVKFHEKQKIFRPICYIGYSRTVILTKDFCFLCFFFLPSPAVYHFYASEGHGVMQYEAMNGIKLHILH